MHKNAQHTADESMTLVALSVSPLGQVPPRKGSLGGPLDSLWGFFGLYGEFLGLSWRLYWTSWDSSWPSWPQLGTFYRFFGLPGSDFIDF